MDRSSAPAKRPRATPSRPWVETAVIYQIFVRSFSPAGDFQSIEARLDHLRDELGVDVLWLMPLHPIGRVLRKGAAGCPYSVQSYEEISPDLGTREDLARLVRSAHGRGMRVIVDWVANHTSWDSHLMRHRPHYFKRGMRKLTREMKEREARKMEVSVHHDPSHHGIAADHMVAIKVDQEERSMMPNAASGYTIADDEEDSAEVEVVLSPLDEWWDVAALDYGTATSDSEEEYEDCVAAIDPSQLGRDVPVVDKSLSRERKRTDAQRELADYMAGVMKSWVQEFDIDGFRCDVSEMVPTFFWRRMVKEIKQFKPDIMMLSEGSLPEHHIRAFDLTYSWNVYDAMTAIVRGEKPASHLDDILEAEAQEFPEGTLRMRFNSNHDKNVQDGPPMKHFGSVEAAHVTSALVFTMGGYGSIRSVPMLYNGDEVGNTTPLDLFEKVAIPWAQLQSSPTAKRKHYQKLIRLRRDHPDLFVHGGMCRARTSHDEDGVFAFARTASATIGERALAIFNLRGEELHDVEISLTWPSEEPIKLVPWYSDEEDDGEGSSTSSLRLVDDQRSRSVLVERLRPYGFHILGMMTTS